MSNSKFTKLDIALISLFIIFFIMIFFILKYEKDIKIEQFLKSQTTIYTQNYNVAFNNNKEISEIIFKTKIDTKEIKDLLKNIDQNNIDQSREKLFQSLRKTYNLLKKNNIKQLHFHRANGDSFLRFHRPNKHGDNLLKVRETVKYVNTKLKPINGFEEGRIYNGYRFVYPLFDKEEHLGSVEVSFSAFAMSKNIILNHNVLATFLILKDKADEKLFEDEKKNYSNSCFDRFYIETESLNYIESLNKYNSKITKDTNDKVNKFFDSSDQFTSIYSNKLDKVLTLLKIKKPITKEAVGLFLIQSSPSYLYNKTKNFYFALALVTLLLIVILFFIRKEIIYRQKIEELNNTLENKIDEAIKNLKTKENLLAQKTKMASMGEMIDSIAHQWMQPVSIIKLRLQTLQLDIKLKELTEKKVVEAVNISINQIQHLVDTVEEFRTFFRPSNDKKVVSIKELINSALILIRSELVKNTIDTKISGDIDKVLEITGSEFKHIIINLINNSKDAFIENKIEDRTIIFDVKIDKEIEISISDNAGGIAENIINKIFNPNFTTKSPEKGTGIGLYMTKQIIDKIGATISVENIKDGSRFNIKLPISFLK